MVQHHAASRHGAAPATDPRRALSGHRQRRAGRPLHLGHGRAAVSAHAVAVRPVPRLSAPLSEAVRRVGQPHDRAYLADPRPLLPEGGQSRSAGCRDRAGAAQRPALLRLHPRRGEAVRGALVRQRIGVQPLGMEGLRAAQARRQVPVRCRGRVQPQPPETAAVHPLPVQLRGGRLRERLAHRVGALRAHAGRRDPARRGGVRGPPRPARE